MLENILESPLDCKEIQLVNHKGYQSWIFTGTTDAEAEAPILWPPDVENWLTGKDPDAGKDWRQEEKGTTEDEMVGWHHQLDGHEFEQALEVGNGQGSLTCCSPWGRRVRHDWATELNWTDPYLRWVLFLAIKYLLNNIWGERVYLGNLHNQSDNLKQAFSYNKYSALSSFTMDLFYYKCEDRDASWPEYINKNCSMRGRRCF